MAITKKNRRKSRVPAAAPVQVENTSEGNVQYKDELQSNLGGKIEEYANRLAAHRKHILYAFAGVGVILLIAGGFYFWKRSQNMKAATALGDAIETSQAFVTEAPMPATVAQKTFKTSKDRSQAAIKEFQGVASTYGSPYSEKAKYFIAVNMLQVDRGEGIKQLQQIASGKDDNAMLAQFALAQEYAAEAKYDDAVKLYQQLMNESDAVVSKDTVEFALAEVYEKQKKDKQAADLYFNIASSAMNRKDSDGNVLPFTQIENEAKLRLEKLDPARAKQIKAPELPGIGQG